MSLFWVHLFTPPQKCYTIATLVTPFHTAHMEMGGIACMLWKNSGLCIIRPNSTIIFLSCLNERGNTCFSCYPPRWKHFMLLSCLSFCSLVKQNAFLSVQSRAFCIKCSEIHRDRKMLSENDKLPRICSRICYYIVNFLSSHCVFELAWKWARTV